jgi:Ni/Co efflux regulator RcnB
MEVPSNKGKQFMQSFRKSKLLLGVGLAFIFAAGPVFADKPEWAGNNKHEKKWNKSEKHADEHGHRYFTDHHRHAVSEYYGKQYDGGKKCPPGLAKKNNGCLPPGQAKKWRVGHPLPHDVVYYGVPRSLFIQLGAPPQGHKYVRVGADILMIAIGSGMVVDAINDLGRM